MTPQAVIALMGPAGSGKSTVAQHLVEKYGAVRYGFATPLKEMVKRALDFTDAQVYGTQEEKEAVDPRYGHSPRWFLQRIGTDGCRAVFGEDFWTKQCLEMIVRQNPRLAVIEDCRFINEAERVYYEPRFSGFVWRLHPVGDEIALERAIGAGLHESETQWAYAPANLEIKPKKRGIQELLALVDKAMEMVPLRTDSDGVRW